jgi:periplasmic divalent cation tolerance protein
MDPVPKPPAGMSKEPKGTGRHRSTTRWEERRQAFAKGDPLRVVFITAPEPEAEGLARKLLEERLIACANLFSGVRSLYWSEGKIENAAETMLVLKTTASRINALMRRVRELHSYTVPEVLALPIMESNPAYAAWVLKQIGSQPQ